MLAHMDIAECESCGKNSKCDLVNDILLCGDCLSRELEVLSSDSKVESIPEPIAKIEEKLFNKPSDVIQKVADSVLADLPQNGNEYFNAEVIDHISLEAKINNDSEIPANEKRFFFAKQLQLRQQHLDRTLLPKVRELWSELKNRSAAVHQDLNVLAGRLRTEEREKLKLADVAYTASHPAKSVKLPRMKAEDKVIENIAKLIYAPRDAKGIVQWESLEAKERENYMNMARNDFKGTKKDVKDLNAGNGGVK